MPRDGSGNFTLPANTQAVSGDPISSTKFNTLVQDLEADANTDRPIVAGGTGASTALAARANLGLEIGVNVQAYDAGLASIAGLTTLADRSIYTTASDTYAVYTLTAAGRAILDDADAAAQRTTLGLGTAALKNTGTSGDAVPLLNVANTFSPLQTFTNPGNASFGAAIELKTTAGTDDPTLAIENYNGGSPVRYGISVKDDGALAFSSDRYSAAIGTERMTLSSAGVLAIGGNTVWHAGNDGAGSGLDADTLDGYNTGTSGATIPLLNAANTFSAFQTFARVAAGTTPPASGSNTAQVQARISASNVGAAGAGLDVFINNSTGMVYLQSHDFNDFASKYALDLNPNGGAVSIAGNTVWHAGNDGAGSTLDADTLDGVEGSAYAALAGTQTFTGAKTFTAEPAVDFAPNTDSGITFRNSTSLRWRLTGATGAESGSNVGSNLTLYRYDDSGTFVGDVLSINRATGAIRATQSFAGRTTASSETTGTLTVASANQTIQATGDITIPNAVFAAGDIILIYAGASSRTITEGASVTMRLGGTATTGSRTLAARGVAVLFFVSSSEVVVSGGAVT
jgi:hypothetical protein